MKTERKHIDLTLAPAGAEKLDAVARQLGAPRLATIRLALRFALSHTDFPAFAAARLEEV